LNNTAAALVFSAPALLSGSVSALPRLRKKRKAHLPDPRLKTI